MDTTVVVTGTWRMAAVPVPMVIGVPAALDTTATALDTDAVIVGKETAEVRTVPGKLTEEEEGICLA